MDTLPSHTQDIKENPKPPSWGPVALGNWVLDGTSSLLAKAVDVVLPYPTEESVAPVRQRISEQERMRVDPVTGACFSR
eukprot:CAMPEP_0197414062 /NCGR_PEP_ID=MMETSP1170-20131217/837_1 /TAXON_ID=54406 /ORGANISM="Sarcinochrysis sp, Strain CCMP770" /LENGTH=78 /DNA_ID=CAMNT_0042940739 /DNA_START=53 /DNA_END=289 /DNA_ORIENTATION=-